jgi:hypothetical protein
MLASCGERLDCLSSISKVSFDLFWERAGASGFPAGVVSFSTVVFLPDYYTDGADGVNCPGLE